MTSSSSTFLPETDEAVLVWLLPSALVRSADGLFAVLVFNIDPLVTGVLACDEVSFTDGDVAVLFLLCFSWFFSAVVVEVAATAPAAFRPENLARSPANGLFFPPFLPDERFDWRVFPRFS